MMLDTCAADSKFQKYEWGLIFLCFVAYSMVLDESFEFTGISYRIHEGARIQGVKRIHPI